MEQTYQEISKNTDKLSTEGYNKRNKHINFNKECMNS